MRKIYLSLCILVGLVAINSAFAQNVDINVNHFGFLDNREYKSMADRSFTVFGNQASLDLGVQLDEVNNFRLGAIATQEFAAKPAIVKVVPIIYYNYHQKNWLLNLGTFSRQGLVDKFPRAILNDTLNYYRPLMMGMLAQYRGKHGHQSVWIDWVSRKVGLDREQFLFGCSGTFKPAADGPLYISNYFVMLHDASAEISSPSDHVNDNGAVQLNIGLDLSRKTFLDSLTIDVGGMMSLERARGISGWNLPKGVVANLFLGWKRFSLADNFYCGEGSNIRYGDSFYNRRIYNRVDLSWTAIRYGAVQGRFVFSFHQMPDDLASNQQAFFLTYDIGRRKLFSFK